MKYLLKRRKLSFQKQFDTIDCGPSCLRMVAKYFGRDYSLEYLREACYLSREGVSLLSINDAAEKIGFRTFMAHLKPDILIKDAPLPAILHWNQDHFVVLYDIKKSLFKKTLFVIADPAHGIVTIDEATFKRAWVSTVDGTGTALFLETSAAFYEKEGISEKNKGFGFLLTYLKPYKFLLFQLVMGMLAASFISLIFPFLTKLLFDSGVVDKDVSIIKLVLFSQLFLFLGSFIIELIRSWLLLHINSRISLNIISDFLIKLLKLPIKFFDTKSVGDLSQRISDHHRIENFLTGSFLSSIFSFFNIIIFVSILAYYDWKIIATFLSLTIIGILWIFLFQKRRMRLDYKRFARNKENQDKLFEMITGMQEIKLFGSETSKRWDWERLQVNYFKLNIKSLILEQSQQTGFFFFSQLKNILISFIAANEAIKGNITLGTLLSISYIIGQTNGPIDQLVTFIKSAQDAKLSLARLQEIHNKTDEEDLHEITESNLWISGRDISVNNISFQYEGPNSAYVLKDVSFTLPSGKITALVGTSGSGKTTLMKLLLGFYSPVAGSVLVGNQNLDNISPKNWRKQCGTVLQDGYIFSDTIARNIALNGGEIDKEKMDSAVRISNLKPFIESLPLKYTTKIGTSGGGLSGGQKQRILIARSVYKDPEYLFFDEATSSLDANNEKVIIDNLSEFFNGKTVLIIAHRLSTVKHADQIVVLEDGKIAEIGNHNSLIATKGKYFELVKNQLELGN